MMRSNYGQWLLLLYKDCFDVNWQTESEKWNPLLGCPRLVK